MKRIQRYQRLKATATDGGYDVTIATSTAVDGVTLAHDEGSVDLSRADPLPLLWSHDASMLPIGVVRDVQVRDGALVGRAEFDMEDPRAAEIAGKVDRGIINGISVGADVDHETMERTEDGIIFRRWQPVEASVVTIPADAGAGINREAIKELFKMEEETTTAPAEDRVQRAVQAHTSAISIGTKREMERQREIRSHYADFLHNSAIAAVMEDCLNDESCSVQEAQSALIRAFAMTGTEPLQPAAPRAQASHDVEPARIEAGTDKSEKFAEGVTRAWLARGRAMFTESGEVDDRAIRAEAADNEFTSYTMMEIVREFCRMHGIATSGDESMLHRAMTYRAGGHTDADLPAILSNVIGKALQVPLTPAEENWRAISRVTSLRDFKVHTRPNLGTASDLEEIASGAGITRGFISDFEETLQARTFGKEIVVEYQTFRNDDLNVLTGLPVELRRKASRKVGDLVWDIFTGNPTLSATGNALFSAAHYNIYTTTNAGAPSVAILEAMMAAMATQRAPSPTGDDTNDPGDYLAIVPRYLLVPHALRGRAEVLMRSTYDPDANAGSQVANTVNGRLEVVPEARLDGFNAAGYFLSADPNRHATLEVGFVDGRDTPMLAQESDWHTRGIKFAVWTDFDVAAMDYRGVAYNDGVGV